MKKLVLLLSIIVLSCNDVNKETNVKNDTIVETPIVIEDSPIVPIEASDSLKDARLKAKDSIKKNLGK